MDINVILRAGLSKHPIQISASQSGFQKSERLLFLKQSPGYFKNSGRRVSLSKVNQLSDKQIKSRNSRGQKTLCFCSILLHSLFQQFYSNSFTQTISGSALHWQRL